MSSYLLKAICIFFPLNLNKGTIENDEIISKSLAVQQKVFRWDIYKKFHIIVQKTSVAQNFTLQPSVSVERICLSVQTGILWLWFVEFKHYKTEWSFSFLVVQNILSPGTIKKIKSIKKSYKFLNEWLMKYTLALYYVVYTVWCEPKYGFATKS